MSCRTELHQVDNSDASCADVLARSGRTVICSLWSIKNLTGDRDPRIQTSLRSVRRCSRPTHETERYETAQWRAGIAMGEARFEGPSRSSMG